jgi:protein required for attachment to host cells
VPLLGAFAGTGNGRMAGEEPSPPRFSANARVARLHQDEEVDMADTWVLVADSARARLFEVARDGPALKEVAAFTNPEGRIAQRELRRDRLPRVNESAGPGRHAIEPHTSLRQKSADRFAHELGKELEKAHATRGCRKIVLVAAPRFLGTLHGALDESLRKCVVAEVKRNLTPMSPARIREYLPTRLG